MIVEILVEPSGCRGWLAFLARRLALGGRMVPTLALAPAETPVPGAMAALLLLERHVLPGRARNGAESADVTLPPAQGAPAIRIDLRGTAHPATGPRTLRPRYDGALGDVAIASAVLAGRSPRIEIEDVGAGRILAAGTASLEAADGLGASMEAVFSRAVALIERALFATDLTAGEATAPVPARPIPPARTAANLAKGLARQAALSAYRLACYAPHWRIGWRFSERGVLDRGDLGGEPWRVLPDPGHRFFADPFPIEWQGRHAIFFEDLDHRVNRGTVACVEIGADGVPGPVLPVLEEPWHLSYPFLIEDSGELFMIPESSAAGDVALYRCTRFPDRWERHATLLSGLEAADATVIRHDGRFWMFCVLRDGVGGYSDTLALFHAPDLLGPWTPHPGNPVLVDVASARPAGAMAWKDGALWRPVQDCRAGYGAALGLARVTRLDTEGFSQEVETVLGPGPLWPGRKLHTLNRWGRLEVIDGCVTRPKPGLLATLAERRYRPQGTSPA